MTWKWTFARLKGLLRLGDADAVRKKESKPDHRFCWYLAGITMLALLLRIRGLNTDLWLDEIHTVMTISQSSVLQMFTSYTSSNNHLLNMLLVKLSVACFGEVEWSVRLPAMIFGTATIPAIYWVARLAMSRWASLNGALLLAVSYHHIFFSQNARGYTAYLFFSLLASGLFVKALREDRAHLWVLYILTMFLNFASLLLSGFVFLSHIIVSGVTIFLLRRRWVSPVPLLRHLAVVFVIVSLLWAQLYAAVLVEASWVLQTVYSQPGSGYQLFSLAFWEEMIRGLSAGFGAGLAFVMLPFALIMGWGFIVLLRRRWELAVALVLPPVLNILFLVFARLTLSPRFLLLGLLLAVISIVLGIGAFSGWIAERCGKSGGHMSHRLTTAAILMICVASLASLKHYYSVPKQAYRASIEYIQEIRRPEEKVFAVDLVVTGYRYYGKRLGLVEGSDFIAMNSSEEFEEATDPNESTLSYAVTTLPRLLRIEHPDLYARITQEWELVRSFPGTIGGGEISVWRRGRR